jgi:hypothetical protein
MNDPDFFTTISRLVEGYQFSAKSYHNLHISGFADWKGTLEMPDVGQNEYIKSISERIEDNILANAFDSIQEDLEGLKKLDGQIIEWLARYVGASSTKEKEDKGRLDRRLNSIINHGPGGRPQGPIWALNPEYQAFIGQSKKLLDLIIEDHLQVNQRIQQLLKGSTENG